MAGVTAAGALDAPATAVGAIVVLSGAAFPEEPLAPVLPSAAALGFAGDPGVIPWAMRPLARTACAASDALPALCASGGFASLASVASLDFPFTLFACVPAVREAGAVEADMEAARVSPKVAPAVEGAAAAALRPGTAGAAAAPPRSVGGALP